ncbi:hypothetical protein TNCV_4944871 [Trichonephila clavipes]|nr:hypothetical protein TNCV_4944871 [Trichonephila clavipes]
MREKGGNRLVKDPDYMVDALKLPNQAPRVSGESLQKCVAWHCPDGTQHFFCWPILAISGQLLASNSRATKYTVEPSWTLVLVKPPFELLHRTLTSIVFTQYCSMGPISHPQSPSI